VDIPTPETVSMVLRACEAGHRDVYSLVLRGRFDREYSYTLATGAEGTTTWWPTVEKLQKQGFDVVAITWLDSLADFMERNTPEGDDDSD
jgi:hypothetical protein